MSETIPRATQVLLDGDLEGAEYLINADDEIDKRSLELEEQCYDMLALQAPMAGDLRQIVAAVKMIGEIERSGDLAVNICKAARRIYGVQLDSQAEDDDRPDGRAGGPVVPPVHRRVQGR